MAKEYKWQNHTQEGRKIAATVGIILAGMAVGTVVAFMTFKYLGLTGTLTQNGPLDICSLILRQAFVIGAVVGCCVHVYFIRRVWR
jgi:hypothetical protein